MMSKDKIIIKRILNDIRVELSDEFDQNFERESFFSEAWERHRSPLRPGGHILVDTGTLRRSVRSEMKETSIRFFTDLPYADIHNEGGEIVVTKRMKGYFWHKYKEAVGGLGFRRNVHGRLIGRERHGDAAEFWKFMALKKEGTTIKIPKRQFLGLSPEVEKAVTDIIEDNLQEYLGNEMEHFEKRLKT